MTLPNEQCMKSPEALVHAWSVYSHNTGRASTCSMQSTQADKMAVGTVHPQQHATASYCKLWQDVLA